MLRLKYRYSINEIQPFGKIPGVHRAENEIKIRWGCNDLPVEE
jgi:hypothetical protein